jgi:UDP-N-acetyl-D-mannosaminuronic acid dehydrogenase
MHSEFQSVCMVGLGYIGLPTAATLAAAGIPVKGTDVNEDVVQRINQGCAHFSEPDLDMLVRASVESGRLKAYATPQPADAFIITVPTPIRDDRSPDMSYVEAAARAIAPVLEPGGLVILESTSPVGTTAEVAKILGQERPDLLEGGALQASVAYCPERILPGQMVAELIQNDRIIGGLNAVASKRAAGLYRMFVRGKILETNAKTAEMVKLIENAYRDVNIAFANEVANIGDAHDIDPWEAIALANHHPRVNILNPGPGVGGHCIAVDPWFLISQNPELSGLMTRARQVNDGRPATVLAKVEAAAETLSSKKIACLGLAFKPNVDDLRESPAVAITSALARQGYEVSAVEPNVTNLPKCLKNSDNLCLTTLDDALDKADIVLLLVGHDEFADIAKTLDGKTIIDTVGLWRNQG